jgi:hypothetical protein
LYNFEPSATDEEIRAAATQYVRKISGYARPSVANAAAFEAAVEAIARDSAVLLGELVTDRPKRNREEELAKAHARGIRRFGE